MWQELQRFSALERTARGMFLRAAALLPLLAVSLRFGGFRKTQAFLQKFLPLSNGPANSAASGCSELTARMVRAAARRTVRRATCLEESLALWWLLGRQGIASELRVGVRKNGEEFQAHAWVERDGAALNEPEAAHQHYAAFDVALTSLPLKQG